MVEMFLKLAEGRDVPLEDGSPWPKDGADVEVTLYIRRRIADGDLIEADTPAPIAPAPTEPLSEIAETPRVKPGKGDK